MSNIVKADDVKSLRTFLESPAVLTQLAKASPNGMKPERLVRQAITLAQANPDLLSCSQLSIIAGIMRAAELGLELSGPLGHAYLVPRTLKGVKEAVFQTGWKGLVALAFRSGNVSSFPVRTVYAADKLIVKYGVGQTLIHEPDYSKADRGEEIGYYAIVNYMAGGFDFEYMTKGEVEAHRKRYKCFGPTWNGPGYAAMAQKTAVRQLARRLSLCPEAQKQAMEEEYEEAGLPQPVQLPDSLVIDVPIPQLAHEDEPAK